jgi:F-type H+-transporting ATPase subunit a
MKAKLFSIFDPSATFHLPLNCIATFIVHFVLHWTFWNEENRIRKLFWVICPPNFIENSKLWKEKRDPKEILWFSFLYSYFFTLKSFKCFPFRIYRTSLFAITLSLAFLLWVCFILHGWFNHSLHISDLQVPLDPLLVGHTLRQENFIDQKIGLKALILYSVCIV